MAGAQPKTFPSSARFSLYRHWLMGYRAQLLPRESFCCLLQLRLLWDAWEASLITAVPSTSTSEK